MINAPRPTMLRMANIFIVTATDISVMRSTDGVTWVLRSTTALVLVAVTYSSGILVALSV